MIPRVIGIIGINGKFGTWLKNFFERHGCTVHGSDVNTELTNADVVRMSEVVIFAVSLGSIVGVIKSVIPDVRPEQLLIDIASHKAAPVAAMLESPANVLGLHPLFAPDDELTWAGKKVAICSERITDQWLGWSQDLMQLLGAMFSLAVPEAHDKLMLLHQNVPHIFLTAWAMVMANSGFQEFERIPDFSTTLSTHMLQMMERMRGNDPVLYGLIQTGNPGSSEIIDWLIKMLLRLKAAIETGDPAVFAKILSDAHTALGPEFFDKIPALVPVKS